MTDETKRKQAPEPGSPITIESDPIYADAAEAAVVILATGQNRPLPTLDEAVRYVAGLNETQKAGARIRTASGAVYGVLEIDRLHHRTPEQNAKLVADTARFEALAREHGADLSEEGFNEALRKIGRSKATTNE